MMKEYQTLECMVKLQYVNITSFTALHHLNFKLHYTLRTLQLFIFEM